MRKGVDELHEMEDKENVVVVVVDKMAERASIHLDGK